MNKKKKSIWGWAMYDWANSAFATTVMAGFFPVFFKEYWSYGVNVNMSTARLGFGNAAAGLLIAVMAPVLGAVADSGSVRKKFLIFFAYLGVLMTAALFLIQKGNWGWAIFFYVMGVIGFSGANIFYDSLLPSVADDNEIDYVSGLGYSMGYLGGGLLFLTNVLMTLVPEKFGLPDAGTAVRYAFVTVALWWGLFTIFTMVWMPEAQTEAAPANGVGFIINGFRQYIGTFKKIRGLKTVFLFLIAYWFYIDGVDTIIRMAVDYGMSIGFDSNDLIIALLITQFVGFPFALLFGKLGQIWHPRKLIYIAIGIYMCVTLLGTIMTHPHEFYILAVLIGMVQGGIQALSRSFYSRLIPKNRTAEFYGFYNMLGKFATILGPVLIGFTGLAVRRMLMPSSPTPDQMLHISRVASRWGIASIILLFAVGAVLLFFVDEEKGKREATLLGK
ncbi:MAG: MFS transporter [Desulfobacterales bacterium]|jgi:UMF1 family MFS transporter|nr:MFS transporter [Desulfobacterales bacterium]